MKPKPETKLSIRQRVAQALFGDVIETEVKTALAAVTVRVDDSAGWDTHQPGPLDRAFHELHQDMDDALEAWRKNFLIRRIVTLVRSYVVGNGITITSSDPDVQGFVERFWHDPDNHLDTRLGPVCDELTRTGEIFPVLFTNRVDGMSYLRFVPAVQIREIETDPDDYEKELRYGQMQLTTSELKWWVGPAHKHALGRARGGRGGSHYPPLMLHFAVNRPIGAVRGEGDLTPILPWARRYSEWLKDRVRLNRQRTRQGMIDIEIADETMVEQKRQQLQRTNPLEAGIYVHGSGETVTLHGLNLDAKDAQDDGLALRLAIAAGANVGLHYLGEGEAVNYATAKEMGEPTVRFYQDRQTGLIAFLCQIVTVAYQRYRVIRGETVPQRLELTAQALEVARADNQALAKAAADVVSAFVEMRSQGWIDDETAVRLAFKFAGENLSQEQIDAILRTDAPAGRLHPPGRLHPAGRPKQQEGA
jgi:hypothetical protein